MKKKKKIRENRELFIVFNNHLLNKYHYNSISGNQTYFKINYKKKLSQKTHHRNQSAFFFNLFDFNLHAHTTEQDII